MFPGQHRVVRSGGLWVLVKAEPTCVAGLWLGRAVHSAGTIRGLSAKVAAARAPRWRRLLRLVGIS
jgi:hypothetical protein